MGLDEESFIDQVKYGFFLKVIKGNMDPLKNLTQEVS